MKKILLFVALSFFFAMSQAQVRFGAKAGLNLSSISGKDVDGYKTKAGFHLGAFATIPVMAKLSVQPEVYYSMQGARWEDDGNKTSLNYLQIPLLARYDVAEKFYAEAGPQIGLMLSAKDKYEGKSIDIKEYLKTTDFSLVIGAGYKVNENVGVNARYNMGIAKWYEEEKNCLFQLGVTYSFAKRSN